MQQQKSAEAIVGLSPQTEGLNKLDELRAAPSMRVELQNALLRCSRPKLRIANSIGEGRL